MNEMQKIRSLKSYIHLRSPHTIISALGLFIGLCYLPNWLRYLFLQIGANGSGSFTLTVCLVTIGGMRLWQQRDNLAAMQPLEVDRWLGHCLSIIGILLFPFCRFALWSEALLWLLVLGGVVVSRWGMSFLRQRSGICWAFALSVYPNPGHVGATLWQTLFPAQILESAMAAVTTLILQSIGQPVTRSGALIHFASHNVEVGWGCSGFDMALAMLGSSLLLGLYRRFARREIVQLMLIGIALALLVNIPRLVLMSLAAVYWGTAAFEFWHGAIGGQVFIVVLLGSYYCCIERLSVKTLN